jgi:hypothetical protein
MNYKHIKNTLRDLVNKYDPENLIEGGAPEDEYDAYINRIISVQSAGHLNEGTLKQIFSAAPKTMDYGSFVRDILDVLKKEDSEPTE